MFRRLPQSLPTDPSIPNDLKELGFRVNENDMVRTIKQPEQKFQIKINRNDRVNDLYREAVNTCVRDIVKQRLQGLGLEVLRLPIGAQPDQPYIPIYVSKGIEQKRRVVVLFGERGKELGIYSFRMMGDDGIKVGSAQEMVDAIVNIPASTASSEAPGIIIANPGQLIWYRGGQRAISHIEYLNLPRKSAVHQPFRIDPVGNRVPGNADHNEHVQYIFENVMTGIAHPSAKFDIIGLEYTGDAVIHHLAENWEIWRTRVNGICLGNPQFRVLELQGDNDGASDFKDFLAKRARAYFVSDLPIETPLPGRDTHGCNCYASGEQLYEEGIMVKSWRSMLDWFNMITVLKDYEEPVFTMIDATNNTIPDDDTWPAVAVEEVD